MENPHSDPIDGIEAEPADVLEQAQPPVSEPVADALASRGRFDAADALDGVEAEPADVLEQVLAATPGDDPRADPESTGIEDDEADDSRRA